MTDLEQKQLIIYKPRSIKCCASCKFCNWPEADQQEALFRCNHRPLAKGLVYSSDIRPQDYCGYWAEEQYE